MINKIKQINKLFLIIFLFLIAANNVSAQASTDANSKKYGVTYPVAELGNCSSFSACRTYCDDQSRRDQCIAFAKKKGFYKEESADNNKANIIQAAKTTLGCSDQASCNQFCNQEENRQKCRDFAQKYNLEERDQGPGDQKIMQKAKEILGCDSETACRGICEQPDNREKCSRFAKEAGIEGGVRRVGPGGCNSEESCRAYCDNHEEECRNFDGGAEDQDREKRPSKGSGGPVCTTRESCIEFCKNPANAEACKNVVIKGDENKGPSAEEVQRQMGALRQNIGQMPEESQECLKRALGANYDKIMAGETLTTPIDGSAMQACFSQGVKEREAKEDLKKPKKVDDFGTEFRNTEFRPSGEPVRPSEFQEIQKEAAPSPVPQVQGVSTKRSLLNMVLDWIRK